MLLKPNTQTSSICQVNPPMITPNCHFLIHPVVLKLEGDSVLNNKSIGIMYDHTTSNNSPQSKYVWPKIVSISMTAISLN